MSELCLDCGQPIEQLGVGRRRKWCTTCRPCSHKPPRLKVERHDKPCAECGTLTPRKYCSQRCKDLSKRIPCAGGCGGLIHLSRTSLPAGKATCRACRSMQPRKEATDPRTPCVDCSALSYGERCRKCRDRFQRVDGRSRSDALRQLQARRADRDRLAAGIYTPHKRQQLRDKWKRQGKTCLYCGVASVQTVDHVLPLALGGTNHEGNLAPACFDCNRLKQDNLLSAWRYGVKVRRWRVPVEPRTPKPRAKRERVWVQTALNVCPICSTLYDHWRKYCSDDCMWEANARAARDRSRAAKGLPVDREAPTKPTRRLRQAA